MKNLSPSRLPLLKRYWYYQQMGGFYFVSTRKEQMACSKEWRKHSFVITACINPHNITEAKIAHVQQLLMEVQRIKEEKRLIISQVLHLTNIKR